MASKNCQYSLNTENCAILNDLAYKIHYSIQKNDEILARVTDLVDTKLRLPNLNNNEHNGEPVLPKLKSRVSSTPKDASGSSNGLGQDLANGSVSTKNGECLDLKQLNKLALELKQPESTEIDSANDYLRNHLDTNLQIGTVPCDETKFSGVKNDRIRQLLIDNYRLLRIKKSKRVENRYIWDIYKAYERLLKEIIIPQLSQDVSNGNMERIAAARMACLDQRFPLEDDVWSAYCEYVDHLEDVLLVTLKLVELLNGHLHNEQIERLATEMGIVEDLLRHLKTGDLRRSRDEIMCK